MVNRQIYLNMYIIWKIVLWFHPREYQNEYIVCKAYLAVLLYWMVTSVVKGKESFKAIILLTAQFRIHLTIYPCELHDYANIRNSANVDQLEFQ